MDSLYIPAPAASEARTGCLAAEENNSWIFMGREHLQNPDVNRTVEPGGVVGRVSPLRAGLAVSDDGAHGVTRPTRFMGSRTRRWVRLSRKRLDNFSGPKAKVLLRQPDQLVPEREDRVKILACLQQ